ncbi:hypothetical protein PybrP1_010012 [[Pythium] brassicae (nom. inval.)]|nr:hypothetical protein PybrP1_010012 [[Pythium] brassicae (nom. inval.)]
MDEGGVYKRDEGDRPMEHSPRGRYIRFDIKLGSGAYKTVYKAYDTDQGIDVAWNAIDIGVLPSAEKTRIIQEVQLLQKLEHKNIINFYGSWFSKEKNQVVFITEIMTSGTLKSYIKRVQFVKWKIIKRWCLAVHKKVAQSVLGTPEFMAPELYDESYDEKIYKKVTAGIRPRGLQRIVSQAAKDFIELCLSRGNGLIDVSAEYLLDHPFLKAQDDDGEMVRCLEEEELEREVKQEQARRAHVSDESFAHELNMESHSKGSDQSATPTDRRRMFPSLSLEPEELSTVSTVSAASAASSSAASSSAAHPLKPAEAAPSRGVDGPADDKTPGKHRMVDLPPMHPGAEPAGHSQPPPPQQPPLQQQQPPPQAHVAPAVVAPALPTAPPALLPAAPPALPPVAPPAQPPAVPPVQLPPAPGPTPPQPIADAPAATDVPVDEPLSGKKDLDHNVNQFLATMPGTESKIQNNRMNVMGGRGHRLELEMSQDADELDVREPASEVALQPADSAAPGDGAPAGSEEQPVAPTAGAPATPGVAVAAMPPAPSVGAPAAPTAESAASPALAPVPAIPLPSFPPRTPSETIVDYSQLRRPSFQADHHVVPVPLEYEAATRVTTLSRPTSASSMSMSSANAALQKKRGRRHEIRAEKDPENDHSIMLYLRLMIDGKSKEIKFPFNLFSDSTHDVACELALDVGILESDLEDIADSISFLATEGKINNLPHVAEDVWEEAPEPHSFPSRPLPHVSKMNFVSNAGLPLMQLQQFPSHLLSPAPGALDMSAASAPAYSLGEPALGDATSLSASSHSVAISGNSIGSVSAAVQPQSGVGSSVQQPPPQPPGPPGGLSSTPPEALLKPALPPAGESHHPGLLDASAGFLRSDGPGPGTSLSASTASVASSSDVPRSPLLHPQLLHAASEIMLNADDSFPKIVEGWERGISVGSVTDPNFMRRVHGMEDRLKIARSAFDERDSNLVAAMRDAEEKHLREVERFRRQMEELSKQRAAIASSERAQPEDDAGLDVDLGQVNFDESIQLGIGLPAGYPSNGVHAVLADPYLEPSRADAAAGMVAVPMLVRHVSDSRRLSDPTRLPLASVSAGAGVTTTHSLPEMATASASEIGTTPPASVTVSTAASSAPAVPAAVAAAASTPPGDASPVPVPHLPSATADAAAPPNA